MNRRGFMKWVTQAAVVGVVAAHIPIDFVPTSIRPASALRYLELEWCRRSKGVKSKNRVKKIGVGRDFFKHLYGELRSFERFNYTADAYTMPTLAYRSAKVFVDGEGWGIKSWE